MRYLRLLISVFIENKSKFGRYIDYQNLFEYHNPYVFEVGLKTINLVFFSDLETVCLL